MGIDAGFDMVPRLSKGVVDEHNWKSFLNTVKDRYHNDDLVEWKINHVVFKIGEHPILPYEGHKFLRFSSKISGRNGETVLEYIQHVALIARCNFGSRVQSWNEMYDQYGFYDWKDVHESIRSYEQPDESEIPTSIAQSVSGFNSMTEMGSPLFEIRTLAGRGKGMVARFNLAKGKRILLEKPLFTTPSMSSQIIMEQAIAGKLKAMSKTEQRQFLSLHNNFPGKFPFSGICKTNALPCGSGSSIGGLYPTICLINHSCLPNAHNNWNDETGYETIHAIRDIALGEEITISYDHGGPLESRREFLKKSFGFDCDCIICSLEATDLQASDIRRQEIQALDAAIGNSGRLMTRPADCLADCHHLYELLTEEYRGAAGALFARVYYDAFQVSITHGDQARASVFADRAYRARLVCEGEDSPNTIRMKRFSDTPMTHLTYGTSQRWRTAKNSIPKGINSTEFEKWLWRQK